MISLRKVTKNDARLLFEWENESEVRANATNQKLISWDEHIAWFACKLLDKLSFIYILTDLHENIGVIRFDNNNGVFIISYLIDKNHRGEGFGFLILEMGMKKIREAVENPIFIGYVKRGNIASEKIFNRLGFSIKKEDVIGGIKFIVYHKME
jgi:RimJ/RimL family protein N-acetyltransferase